MKPNWIGNDALQRYAESHPPKSRIILETVTTTSSDIKDTKADWDGADSIAGWTTLPEGGATPTGTSTNRVSYQPADDEDVITSLPGITGATVAAPIVAWDTGPDDAQAGIKSVTARLDPDANGTGKEVTTWTCQLFRIKEVRTGTLEGETWDLEAISINKAVTAPGAVSDVEFAFPGISPAIGDPPSFADEQSRLESLIPERIPHTVIVIGAYKGDGTVASNVAWLGDVDTNTTTSNGHRLRHYSMAQIDKQFENQTVARVEVAAAATGLPRFQIKANSFTQQTITFTTNQIDLGTTPTGSVEVVVEHEQPGGASGQAQARNNGSTSWIAVSDGDLVEDVAGLSSTGPLYDMRYIATPSTSGWTVPTIRRLGMREIARETVDGIARIGDTRYQMDPRTLKASIPTMQVELTRDGVKDYRDFATELFSDNHAGDLEFRVMYGHPDLARSNWLHLDNFRLHDYDTAGESVVIEAIHPLALTKRVIPTGSTSGQNAVVFAGTTDTAETVYGDILDTVGLQTRYRGVELTKSSTGFTLPKIGKTLSRPRPAKEELDRVAFIEGVSVVPSGGRLKARRIWTSTGGPYNSPVAHFDHIIPVSVSPNLEQRVVDYRVPYNYDLALDGGRGGFANAVYQTSTSAVSKLGYTPLPGAQELDAETSEWLQGSTYASFIAKRTIAAFKNGAIVIRFRSMDPRPWLEIGDVVEVSTDRFIGRGLETDRALRGRLSVIGPIVEHNIQGTEFSVWVPEIETAIPSSDNIAVTYGRRPLIDLPDFEPIVFRPKGSTTATASITVRDPGLRMVTGSSALQYRERIGGSTLGAWTNWTTGSTTAPGVDTTVTRSRTVNAPAGLDSEFQWRMHWTDADGTARRYASDHRIVNLDSVSKTLRVSAGDWSRQVAGVGILKTAFFGTTNGVSASQIWHANLDIPYGAQVTGARVRHFKSSTSITGTGGRVLIQEWGSTGNLIATHATINYPTGVTGWRSSTASFTHTVTSTGNFLANANINKSGGSTSDDVRIAWLEIFYDAPDYTKTR